MKSSIMRIVYMLLLVMGPFTMWGQRPVTPAPSKPFVLGVTEELYSKELGERRLLNIYLPPGYAANDSTLYPVVYLLDGSADEDFIHVVGLYQFLAFPWIQTVPPSIIVGIATVDRRRDFTYPTTLEPDRKKYPTTGHSEAFLRFLEKDLQPYIQQHYKTGGGRTLIGQSLGGLVATEILFKKPDLFDQYIILSPSLWWDNGSLLSLDPVALRTSTQPKSIYIGVGKEGLTSTAVPRVMEVDANLLADKVEQLKQPNLTLYFEYLPKEDHATIMHQALLNALRLLAPPPAATH